MAAGTTQLAAMVTICRGPMAGNRQSIGAALETREMLPAPQLVKARATAAPKPKSFITRIRRE